MICKDDYEKQKSTKRYKASDDFIYRNIAGSGVLISVGNNIADFNGYIELNESASFIWKRLQNTASLEELVTALQEKYQVSRQQAVEDLIEILNEMISHKLVELQ